MDLNTSRTPTGHLGLPHNIVPERECISLRGYMIGHIFSSPLSPEDPVPKEQAFHRPAQMATGNTDDEIKSTSSAPSCGQPLDQDEVDPPLTLNIIPLADYIKNQPRPSTVNSGSPNEERRPSTQYVSRFYLLCQKQQIVPQITETEVAPYRFTATVEFGEEKVSLQNEDFPSKKAAREAVCKLAIDRLLADTDASSQGSKRKATTPSLPPSAIDNSENWIGILQEYAQRERISLPTYTESMASAAPILFNYTVSIPHLSVTCSSIAEGPHSSKQAAKASAAKAAVKILRAQGHIPATGEVSKRRKSSTTAAKYGGGTGLTQVMDNFHVGNPSTAAAPSLKQQVHDLCMSIGLQTPMWDVQGSAPEEGKEALPLWDVAARFSERDVKAVSKSGWPDRTDSEGIWEGEREDGVL